MLKTIWKKRTDKIMISGGGQSIYGLRWYD